MTPGKGGLGGGVQKGRERRCSRHTGRRPPVVGYGRPSQEPLHFGQATNSCTSDSAGLAWALREVAGFVPRWMQRKIKIKHRNTDQEQSKASGQWDTETLQS